MLNRSLVPVHELEAKATTAFNATESRRRLIRMMNVLESSSERLDAFLLIAGIDASDCVSNSRAIAYLLLGASGQNLAEPQLPKELEDTFIVIYRGGVTVYTTPPGGYIVSRVTALWPQCKVVSMSPQQFKDQGLFEEHKVESFRDILTPFNRIGTPLDRTADVPKKVIEKWPLVQSWAVGDTYAKNPTFFTLEKHVVNVLPDFNASLYTHLDVYDVWMTAAAWVPAVEYQWGVTTKSIGRVRKLIGEPNKGGIVDDENLVSLVAENLDLYYQYGGMKRSPVDNDGTADSSSQPDSLVPVATLRPSSQATITLMPQLHAPQAEVIHFGTDRCVTVKFSAPTAPVRVSRTFFMIGEANTAGGNTSDSDNISPSGELLLQYVNVCAALRNALETIPTSDRGVSSVDVCEVVYRFVETATALRELEVSVMPLFNAPYVGGAARLPTFEDRSRLVVSICYYVEVSFKPPLAKVSDPPLVFGETIFVPFNAQFATIHGSAGEQPQTSLLREGAHAFTSASVCCFQPLNLTSSIQPLELWATSAELLSKEKQLEDELTRISSLPPSQQSSQTATLSELGVWNASNFIAEWSTEDGVACCFVSRSSDGTNAADVSATQQRCEDGVHKEAVTAIVAALTNDEMKIGIFNNAIVVFHKRYGLIGPMVLGAQQRAAAAAASNVNPVIVEAIEVIDPPHLDDLLIVTVRISSADVKTTLPWRNALISDSVTLTLKPSSAARKTFLQEVLPKWRRCMNVVKSVMQPDDEQAIVGQSAAGAEGPLLRLFAGDSDFKTFNLGPFVREVQLCVSTQATAVKNFVSVTKDNKRPLPSALDAPFRLGGMNKDAQQQQRYEYEDKESKLRADASVITQLTAQRYGSRTRAALGQGQHHPHRSAGVKFSASASDDSLVAAQELAIEGRFNAGRLCETLLIQSMSCRRNFVQACEENLAVIRGAYVGVSSSAESNTAQFVEAHIRSTTSTIIKVHIITGLPGSGKHKVAESARRSLEAEAARVRGFKGADVNVVCRVLCSDVADTTSFLKTKLENQFEAAVVGIVGEASQPSTSATSVTVAHFIYVAPGFTPVLEVLHAVQEQVARLSNAHKSVGGTRGVKAFVASTTAVVNVDLFYQDNTCDYNWDPVNNAPFHVADHQYALLLPGFVTQYLLYSASNACLAMVPRVQRAVDDLIANPTTMKNNFTFSVEECVRNLSLTTDAGINPLTAHLVSEAAAYARAISFSPLYGAQCIALQAVSSALYPRTLVINFKKLAVTKPNVHEMCSLIASGAAHTPLAHSLIVKGHIHVDGCSVEMNAFHKKPFLTRYKVRQTDEVVRVAQSFVIIGSRLNPTDVEAFLLRQLRYSGSVLDDLTGAASRVTFTGRRPLITKEILVEKDIQKIVAQSFNVPLPSNWRYNGYEYVMESSDGTSIKTSETRPDIDQLVEDFVVKTNKEIEEENRLLRA